MAKRESDGKEVKKRGRFNKDGQPNAYWRQFKRRLDEYDQIPVQEWKEENILGHILKRYKDQKNIEFTLSYSGAPSRCSELYCVRRMIMTLGTDDYTVIKKYVDWVYDTLVIPNNVTISSLGYFFTRDIVLKFKKDLPKTVVSRASNLPQDILDVANKLSISDIRTYGDLAFAKIAIQDDPYNQDMEKFVLLFDALKNEGFDDSVLVSLE